METEVKEAQGKIVSAENPANVDNYNVGDTYKITEHNISGGTAIDLSFDDEGCTQTRWLLSLKDSYALVTIPELCQDTLDSSNSSKSAYESLRMQLFRSMTVF